MNVICPTDESLSLLLQEKHAPATHTDIIGHIEDCADCERRLAGLVDETAWVVGDTPLPDEAKAALSQVLHHLKCPAETLIGDSTGDLAPPTGDASHPSLLSNAFPDLPQREGAIGAIGRYEVLSEIGRGGMGVLYEGVDTKEQQPVALKVLHGWLVNRPEAIQRMQREADAAVRVRHPGVLAVHELLKPDGMPPVLVMELLSGRTLTELLKERGNDVTDVKPILRKLVGAIRGLAALNDAGIVHRDIKPSNLLLDTDESGEERLIVGDLGLVRDEEAESDLTRTENLLGTPAYMSPEQIARPNAVDARSDVYSMGCVIYQTLTGVPPFEGSLRMILWQATHADVRPPRQLNDAVDRDVETICLKAMSKRPEERYQSAEELADDLERYLSGKSIQAKPPGPVKRLIRWASKNPATAVAASSVAFILLATTVSSVLVARTLAAAKTRETHAKELAQENALAAKQQSQLALQTLTSVVQDVQTGLQAVAGGSEVRIRILRTALEKLQLVSTQYLAQASVDQNTVRALIGMGDVVRELGVSGLANDSAQSKLQQSAVQLADDYYRRAQEIAEKIAAGESKNTLAQQDLIHSLERRGDTQLLLGDTAAAFQYYERCRKAAEQGVKADSASVPFRRELSTAWMHIGDVQLQLGDSATALESHNRSLELRQQLAKSAPENIDLKRDISMSHTRIGQIQMDSGDGAGAMTSFEASLRLDKELTAAEPDNVAFQNDLIVSHSRMGMLHSRTGNLEAALASHRKALGNRQKLVAAAPNNIQEQRGLAAIFETIGSVEFQAGDSPAAMKSFNKALDIVKKRAAADPADTQSQSDLSLCYFRIGKLKLQADDLQGALDEFNLCLAIRQALVKKDADNATWQRDLTIVLNSLGETYGRMNNRKSLECHATSLEIARKLAGDAVDNPQLQQDLVIELYQLGASNRHFGEYLAAAKAFQEAADTAQRMIDHKQMLEFATQVRADMLSKANLMQRLNIAVGDWEVVLQQPAGELPALLEMRGMTRVRAGEIKDAVRAVTKLSQLENVSPEQLYNAACVFALSAASIDEDGTDLTAQLQKQRDGWISDSLETLRSAVAAGWNKFALMRKDPDLDSLRDQAGFRELMEAGTAPR